MRTRTIQTLFLLLVAALGVSQAKAGPILIDFTDMSQWGSAVGETSYSQTYGSLNVTVNATGGTMTFNSHEAPTGGPGSSYMAFQGDGLGIGDDEISWGGSQLLQVSFSSQVTVLGYYFLDFFANDQGVADERALVTLYTADGLVILDDTAYATDAWGFYAREGLGIDGTNSLSFSASIGDHRKNDYALAGLLVAFYSVPEPGTLGLLVVAFGTALMLRRRRDVMAARSH
jgi:hypothetical protein